MKLHETKNNVQELESSHNIEKQAEDAHDHREHAERLENNDHIGEKNADGATQNTLDHRNHKESESVVESRVENVEKEITSPFSRENFKFENSFDAKSKEIHPALNELKCKNVYDVKAMGEPVSDAERAPKGEYTPEERDCLKEIRDKIDAPTTETVMQKVICVDTGNIDNDLKYYIDPQPRNNQEPKAQVYGFVSKAEDAVAFTTTPQECHDNLRLDYKGSPYDNTEKSVYVIRFTDGNNYEIPYSIEFGGNTSDSAPFSGNGFTSSKDVTIPEYTIPKDSKDNGAIVTNGEIYRINPDGKEELVATFDRDDEKFYLINKEAENDRKVS